MATDQVAINPNDNGVNQADDEYIYTIDNTTSATYTYFARTYKVDAATTDYVWQCWAIRNATGTKRFATDPTTGRETSGKVTRAFVLQASAIATYTYTGI